jgi:hypothetical protein
MTFQAKIFNSGLFKELIPEDHHSKENFKFESEGKEYISFHLTKKIVGASGIIGFRHTSNYGGKLKELHFVIWTKALVGRKFKEKSYEDTFEENPVFRMTFQVFDKDHPLNNTGEPLLAPNNPSIQIITTVDNPINPYLRGLMIKAENIWNKKIDSDSITVKSNKEV